METHQASQVCVGERVAAYNEKPLALEVQLGFGHLYGARGAGGGVFYGVVDVDTPVGAVAEVVLYLFRHELERYDDVGEVVAFEQLYDVLHARDTDYGDHRFRLVAGQRPQAGSLSAGHNYRLHVAPPPPGIREMLIRYISAASRERPKPA